MMTEGTQRIETQKYASKRVKEGARQNNKEY
jgi:hypothetical protein